jgi:hypothetical protein
MRRNALMPRSIFWIFRCQAEAFGRYIDYVSSCRRLMTLLETHRSFPFSKLMAHLRRSRLKRRMQVAIKLLRNGIELIVTEPAEAG